MVRLWVGEIPGGWFTLHIKLKEDFILSVSSFFSPFALEIKDLDSSDAVTE